ncbi:MAG: hypothetical protein N2255_06910 [Kiritimatiellae bacterium]|nr:hypothetical protein [Kiritimatiellia bacterium]
MKAVELGVVIVASIMAAFPQVVQATVCYGYDATTKYQISPTDPGGWTPFANIDAAVAAGVAAGRSVIEFLGTWSGIDETIDLRNDGLIFQGATGCSMNWSASYSGAAFGDRDDATFSATIRNLTITTTYSGNNTQGRGVTWYHDVWATSQSGTLTVSNCVFTTTGDAIYVVANTGGGSAKCPVTVKVFDSKIKSSAGSGVIAQGAQGWTSGAVALLWVLNSRVEAYQHGVQLTPTSGGAGAPPTPDCRVEACEIFSNNALSGAYKGITITFNTTASPLRVMDTLVAGFGIGVSDENPAIDQAEARVLLNNTIVGTGSSTGLCIRLGAQGGHNWDGQTGMIVNNIFAGHDAGIAMGGTVNNTASITLYGDKNAYFANNVHRKTLTGNVLVAYNDATRVEPGYTLAQAFVDPVNPVLTKRKYRLLLSATALLDAGEQFTTGSLGGTTTFVDRNNNGTYEDGTDYVISLGGGTPTASTRLMLVDAETANPKPRLKDGNVDIGAYEGPPPRPKGTAVFVR